MGELTPAEREAASVAGRAFATRDASLMASAMADAVANAVEVIAAAVKRVSQGNALTIFFYGYLYALGYEDLAASGHINIARVLACKDVDAIASPYMCVRPLTRP